MKFLFISSLLLNAACAESPYKNRDVTYRAVRTHEQVLFVCKKDKNCGYDVKNYVKQYSGK